jgi:hypothetical protein
MKRSEFRHISTHLKEQKDKLEKKKSIDKETRIFSSIKINKENNF